MSCLNAPEAVDQVVDKVSVQAAEEASATD
jgi:hypothetical protein